MPSSLLILSRYLSIFSVKILSFQGFAGKLFHSLCRAFSVSGKVRPEEAVQATLSSLPDEVVDTVGVTTLPSEDSVSERKRKLEYLEMQEELIKVGFSALWILLLGIYMFWEGATRLLIQSQV